jgi:hypothetical protein
MNSMVKARTPAVYFSFLYNQIVEICRERGYAAALHGSMARDLDVIAIPWTEEAVPADELVAAIAEATGGYRERCLEEGEEILRTPIQKPHGRLSWLISFHDNLHLDFSVMPLVPK